MEHIEKATQYIRTFFSEKIDPKYTYHNLEHTLLVLSSSKKILKKSKLEAQDKLIVQFAALFHDTGFADGPENHEQRGAQIAEAYLLENGFESKFIEKVKACIHATKMNTQTNDLLSQILQDADMSGLASKKFFEITERLRQERNNLQSDEISKKEWDETNINFLKKCAYKTEVAKSLYQAKKEKNLASLVERHKNKVQTKKTNPPTIASNKSAQTQFKTALRNHIDLSNIADNKANIMISVNALILTVALPFLIDKAIENNAFLIPTIIMSIVCLVSMIFATLSTRPIKMIGHTSESQIKQNKSNLFFFGNYHKMTFDEYKSGVEYVVSNDNALNDSIMRDLYFLGKSLGGKFEYLRLCYNVFMYGITVTVLSMAAVYFI